MTIHARYLTLQTAAFCYLDVALPTGRLFHYVSGSATRPRIHECPDGSPAAQPQCTDNGAISNPPVAINRHQPIHRGPPDHRGTDNAQGTPACTAWRSAGRGAVGAAGIRDRVREDPSTPRHLTR